VDDLPGSAAHCEGHCAESFVFTKALVLFCYIWPTYILNAILMGLFNDTKCLYIVITYLLHIVLEENCTVSK